MFTEIDVENWPRKATFEFFRGFEDPFFNFTGNLDVTDFYAFCKRSDLSISLSILYYVLAAVNEIPEFRVRLMNGKLIEFDRIHATQTILNDDETFSFAYFEMRENVYGFNAAGRESLQKYKRLKTFDVESGRLDLIYCSVIPWVSFTSFKHATRIDPSHTVPRIVFGKMFDEASVKKMPLSVEANHMTMDGFHVGKLFTRVQESITGL